MTEKATDMATDASACVGPCDDAQQHLWDYLDGELCEGDCEGIKAHLADCPTCRQLFDSEKKMKDAVSRACGCDSAPQDLRSRVASLVNSLRDEACGKKQSRQ